MGRIVSNTTLVFAWIEFCWGIWIFQHPSNGTAIYIPDIWAYVFLFNSLMKFISWKTQKINLVSSMISVHLFILTMFAVIHAQGIFSALSIMYSGFLVIILGKLYNDIAINYYLKDKNLCTRQDWKQSLPQ